MDYVVEEHVVVDSPGYDAGFYGGGVGVLDYGTTVVDYGPTYVAPAIVDYGATTTVVDYGPGVAPGCYCLLF